jgi:hypothetical protein
MVTISGLPASRHRVPASQNALNGNHPEPEWLLLEPASFMAGYASFVAGYAAGV